jgi:tetratricopeptide (TPR) repeat protein
MAAAARDAAFTVDLALAPAYERINAVTLPPVSCPASSCSHALPRFPPRPRLPPVRRVPVQPSYAASLCNYGRLLQKRQHDLDLAGDLMAKAVRLHPEQPALMSSYALFLEDGVRDPIRAQEVYERALQLHPSDTVPFCSLFRMA